jgi:maltose alpha-D-glucosyltransferase/alpha-amylase
MQNVAQLPLLFASHLEDLLGSDTARAQLEKQVLPAYLIRQRWYRSKTRKLTKIGLNVWSRFPAEIGNRSVIALLKVEFEEGEMEWYALPLASIREEDASVSPEAVLCRLSCQDGKQLLIDALHLPPFRAALLKFLLNKTQLPLGDGILKGKPFSDAYQILKPDGDVPSQLIKGEQSNTSTLFTEHFLKLYRRLDEGINPEPEILRFLQTVRYPHVPTFHALLEWERSEQHSVTIALAQKRIEMGENGWEYVLAQLSGDPSLPSVDTQISEELATWIRLLGRRTAGLHLALASRPDEKDFAPEELAAEDLEEVRSSASRLLKSALGVLGNRSAKDLQPLRMAISRLERLEGVLAQAGGGHLGGKIRVHGDFHLGQIQKGTQDIWFLDFEGEPARSLAEKRRKRSPLRDAASMLRSFHYAAHTAWLKGSLPSSESSTEDSSPSSHSAGYSETRIPLALGELFLEAYYDILGGSTLLPQNSSVRAALLDLFVLEKAVYELHYELNHRPDWVEIPLRGLATLANP